MAEEEYARVQVQEGESNVVVEKRGNEGRKYNDLPLDIAAEIAGRLTLGDYLHLRTACTVFRSVSPPVDWKKKALEGLELPPLSPWLIFFEKDGVCSLVDPRHGDKYLISLPPSLSNCGIYYSKNGWFLMSGNTDSTFLFNPFTRKIVPFPKDDIPYRFFTSYMGFSCYPTSSDCLVVVFGQKFYQKVYLSYTRLGGQGWTDVDFHSSMDFVFCENSPVFYQGAFYCLGRGGNLGVLQFTAGEVTWRVLLKPTRPCSSYHQNFLVECNGKLLSVFVGEFGKGVRVFKLNHSPMAWIEVESLGHYMIYISRSSSLAAMATAPGMENKINFPRFCGQSSHSIVFYSLDTKKFHSFESGNAEVDFYSTREQLCACWIEPNWC
ncbi:hypothetical protein QUC31_001762 [Theobroma cacao]